jgi:hypothetical protein
MNLQRTLSVTVFLGLSGVALSGCNYIQKKISEKVTESVVENASGGQFDVDMDDKEYTITTDEGTVNIGSTDLTAVKAVVTLPDWVTGGENAGVMSSESEGKQSVYASLMSSKSLDETYEYFAKYLKDQGFSDITTADYAGTKMVSGTKGEDKSTSVAVTVSDNKDDGIEGVQVVVVYSGPAQQ